MQNLTAPGSEITSPATPPQCQPAANGESPTPTDR